MSSRLSQTMVPALSRSPDRVMSRQVAIVMIALGLALMMLGIVLAANNTSSFPPAAEQIDLGEGYTGTYTDTRTADGIYRVLRETYVAGTARTLGDDPNDFPYRGTYTGVIGFIPYTMPAEGGFIYRIAPYMFQTGTTQLRVALYADTDGLPRLLLAQSDVLTVSDVLTEPGWLWFEIEPQWIPGNTRYWIAYQADNDEAKLGWRYTFPTEEEWRQRPWGWRPFPSLAGTTWGTGSSWRTCFQIAYTTTQYALNVAYTIPVTPSLDAYTLTVRGATSGEPFSITADGNPVGLIVYTPTAHTAFSDDIESGPGGWTADGFYRVISGTGYYSSPEHAWWTDDVPYASTATLTSAPIPIPFSARNAELRFWMRMISDFEWDGGWLEYRIRDENGDWSSWSEISPTDIIKGGYNCILGAPSECTGLTRLNSGPHNGWSGGGEALSGTIRVQIPLSATGHLIQWRWVFECAPLSGQPATQPDGWWIDDVRVVATTSEDTMLVWPLPVSAADDGQVVVRFQDTLTNTYPDLLGIDLIKITGILYNRAPVVTVTFPDGGEYLSGTQTVTWTGLDVNGDVVTYNIYLSLDDGANWTDSLYEITYAETGDPAVHSWTGFNTAAFTDCNQCRIRITASDGETSTYDLSDAVFVIDNTPPTVTLTAPNGGELLRGGSAFTITWTADDNHFGPTPIALAYSTDGGITYTPIITATANNGEYLWTVPEVETTTVRVRVTATDRVGHSASDASNANFAIDSTAPTVTLTAPNGGELLRGGSAFTITWTASDNHFGPTPIALAYSTDGGITYAPIVTATADDGEYLWTVPEVETTTVRVRVIATDLVGHSTSDVSDANFAIDATAPTVTLTAPNGGELLRGGSVFTITWTADDNHFGPTPIALAYSTDGGITYTPIVTATADDGEYLWTVPEVETTTVRVRVTATDRVGHSASDESDADFAIDSTPPEVTLTAPSGGELLRGGSVFTITWTAVDAHWGPAPIALAYSLDGGNTYTDIVTATANNGQYVWTVPTVDSNRVRIQVTATDLVGHSVSDESGNFTIDSSPPTGTISIAEGAYTRVRNVQLLLTASDDVAQMYLDGDLEAAPNVRQWVTYTASVTVTLASDDGVKTVRVRYQDVVGNLSGWAEAQIIYDATPPMIADISPADGSVVTTATPVISATVRDETSGIDSQAITMTVDGVLANPVYNSNTVSWIPDPPLTNISHTVTLLVQDRAGNITSTIWTFAVDEPPSTLLLTASPPAIVADGISTATITATVTDRYSNPVADGTEVVFTTTLGTLSGDAVYTTTTQSGFAIAVLTASTTDGVARVTARAGLAEGSAEIRFIRYRVYLPLVLRLGGP